MKPHASVWGALLLAGFARAQTYEVVHTFGAARGEPAGRLVEVAGSLYGTAYLGGPFGRGAVFALTPDGQGGFTFSELHAFCGPDGRQAFSPLVYSVDGYFYGTTIGGGAQDFGTVYRLDTSGRVTTIRSFDGTDGQSPTAGLLEAGNGLLYGTSRSGFGSVFRMDRDGQITTLHTFNAADGFEPIATLIEASDGAFYGTTTNGGPTNAGTIYRIDADGNFTSLHGFITSDGQDPYGGLAEGSDGNLYGATAFGGDNDAGVVYRVTPTGDFTVIHHFTGTDGGVAQAALIRGSDDLLYGTTTFGGAHGKGTVFRVDLSGALTTLHDFAGPDGAEPIGALVEASNGKFYGTTQKGGNGGGGIVFELESTGALTTVHSFFLDPESPWTAVVETPDGSLFGTTHSGGLTGLGAVYRIAPDGQFSTVHGFDVATDGALPDVDLMLASDGNLYGATTIGIPSNGTIFRVGPNEPFATIHFFDGTGGETGAQPMGPIAEGAPGVFFGTTSAGGANLSGTVFQMDGTGAATTIHDFESTLGNAPAGALALSAGAIRGTTLLGGANGHGIVFEIDATNQFSDVHDFATLDGDNPRAGLRAGTDGDFYGTTYYGGAHGHGTVFRIDAPGMLTTLHSFDMADGQYPSAGVIEASDGMFYGTTAWGGIGGGQGTIYRVSAAGDFESLFSFHGSDGNFPYAGLVEASGGGLYGTAAYGGFFDHGVVFRLSATDTVPGITAVSPSSGPSGGETALRIRGIHFRPSSTATIGSLVPRGVIAYDSGTVRAIAPAFAPGTLQEVVVTGPDATTATLSNGWFADFLDVDSVHLFHDFIESIVRAGITAGCGGGHYCPASPVTRAQMAVFLLKAEHGIAYVPPACTGLFVDVPCPAGFAADWIEQLSAEGVTAGCGGGSYCPGSPVTRAQMAVFLLKTLLGPAYIPPVATGIFGDVPQGAFAADWVEDLYGRSVTGGCSASPLLYCPANANTRGQMAVFLVRTFGI